MYFLSVREMNRHYTDGFFRFAKKIQLCNTFKLEKQQVYPYPIQDFYCPEKYFGTNRNMLLRQ